MAGFVPLLSLPEMPQYIHVTVEKVRNHNSIEQTLINTSLKTKYIHVTIEMVHMKAQIKLINT